MAKPWPPAAPPACTKNEERPRDHFTIARFPAAPSLELVIQVSNHHNTQGGLGGWIMLGTAQDVQGHMRFLWLSGALVSGALLCMSLYHFALFFLRRSFKANLYFGLFCFFWSMATGFSPTSGFLMAAMGLKLNWGLYVTLATLPFGLTTPDVVALLPDPVSQTIRKSRDRDLCCVGGALHQLHPGHSPQLPTTPCSLATFCLPEWRTSTSSPCLFWMRYAGNMEFCGLFQATLGWRTRNWTIFFST